MGNRICTCQPTKLSEVTDLEAEMELLLPKNYQKKSKLDLALPNEAAPKVFLSLSKTSASAKTSLVGGLDSHARARILESVLECIARCEADASFQQYDHCFRAFECFRKVQDGKSAAAKTDKNCEEDCVTPLVNIYSRPVHLDDQQDPSYRPQLDARSSYIILHIMRAARSVLSPPRDTNYPIPDDSILTALGTCSTCFTPRGLASHFSAKAPKRAREEASIRVSTNAEPADVRKHEFYYSYKTYVFHGTSSSSLLAAHTLTNTLAFDNALNSAPSFFLPYLFYGLDTHIALESLARDMPAMPGDNIVPIPKQLSLPSFDDSSKANIIPRSSDALQATLADGNNQPLLQLYRDYVLLRSIYNMLVPPAPGQQPLHEQLLRQRAPQTLQAKSSVRKPIAPSKDIDNGAALQHPTEKKTDNEVKRNAPTSAPPRLPLKTSLPVLGLSGLGNGKLPPSSTPPSIPLDQGLPALGGRVSEEQDQDNRNASKPSLSVSLPKLPLNASVDEDVPPVHRFRTCTNEDAQEEEAAKKPDVEGREPPGAIDFNLPLPPKKLSLAVTSIEGILKQQSKDGTDDPLTNYQDDRQMRLRALMPVASEILPYLYVGGETASQDREQLLRLGITLVINAAAVSIKASYPEEFEYLMLYLSDSPDEMIEAAFPLVNRAIERTRRSGGRVFIHCHQGVSRSTTLTIAYLMWRFGWTFDYALDYAKKRRSIVSPNSGFFAKLISWERHLAAPPLSLAWAYLPFSSNLPKPFVFKPIHIRDVFSTCSDDSTVKQEQHILTLDVRTCYVAFTRCTPDEEAASSSAYAADGITSLFDIFSESNGARIVEPTDNTWKINGAIPPNGAIGSGKVTYPRGAPVIKGVNDTYKVVFYAGECCHPAVVADAQRECASLIPYAFFTGAAPQPDGVLPEGTSLPGSSNEAIGQRLSVSCFNGRREEITFTPVNFGLGQQLLEEEESNIEKAAVSASLALAYGDKRGIEKQRAELAEASEREHSAVVQERICAAMAQYIVMASSDLASANQLGDSNHFRECDSLAAIMDGSSNISPLAAASIRQPLPSIPKPREQIADFFATIIRGPHPNLLRRMYQQAQDSAAMRSRPSSGIRTLPLAIKGSIGSTTVIGADAFADIEDNRGSSMELSMLSVFGPSSPNPAPPLRLRILIGRDGSNDHMLTGTATQVYLEAFSERIEAAAAAPDRALKRDEAIKALADVVVKKSESDSTGPRRKTEPIISGAGLPLPLGTLDGRNNSGAASVDTDPADAEEDPLSVYEYPFSFDDGPIEYIDLEDLLPEGAYAIISRRRANAAATHRRRHVVFLWRGASCPHEWDTIQDDYHANLASKVMLDSHTRAVDIQEDFEEQGQESEDFFIIMK